MSNLLFNCLLDGFPKEFMGYQINTDFKVGILLSLLMEDDDIPDDLRFLQAFNLLYKEKVPDDENVAIRGLMWFLSCGRSEICYADGYQDEKQKEPCIDFNQDHMDIWGAFWARGIDLTTAKMHWFKFMSAIGNLGDCPLSNKMSYRATDVSKMHGDTKKYYKELKDKYKVRKIITVEEMDKLLKKAEEKHGSYYAKLLQAQRG